MSAVALGLALVLSATSAAAAPSRLYWSEAYSTFVGGQLKTYRLIKRVDLVANTYPVVVHQEIVNGSESSGGFAVDTVNNRLYRYHTALERFDLATMARTTLPNSGWTYSMQVVPALGMLLRAQVSPGVTRTNLDGQNAVVIANTNGAVGVAYDDLTGKLYWSDSPGKRIRRANLDGSNVETLAVVNNQYVGGIALDRKRGLGRRLNERI